MTTALLVDLALPALLLATAAWAQLLVADLRTLPVSAPAGGTASVSVVVPARDEELTLPALLSSVAEQLPEVREVVVVDDASQDDTAGAARAGGARVLPAGSPPPGWTGKAWACHTGAAATTGDLVLLLDADTVLRPGALAGLVAAHATHGGLVSVQPHHDVVRPYEQLSAYFNVVALMASAAFTRPDRAPDRQSRPVVGGGERGVVEDVGADGLVPACSEVVLPRGHQARPERHRHTGRRGRAGAGEGRAGHQRDDVEVGRQLLVGAYDVVVRLHRHEPPVGGVSCELMRGTS